MSTRTWGETWGNTWGFTWGGTLAPDPWKPDVIITKRVPDTPPAGLIAKRVLQVAFGGQEKRVPHTPTDPPEYDT